MTAVEGHVDGVPDDRVTHPLACSDVAGKDDAAVDPDPHAQAREPLGLPAPVQLPQAPVHVDGRLHGVDRVLWSFGDLHDVVAALR